MNTSFSNKIQSTILLASALLISACATIQTGETVANQTDQATSVVIEKSTIETLPESSSSAKKAIEPLNSVSGAAPNSSESVKPIATRINLKEPFVNVRTSPTTKSRIVSVLKKGQSVEVLKTKDNWVKIQWRKGKVEKQGWLKKMFVEDYEQERQ